MSKNQLETLLQIKKSAANRFKRFKSYVATDKHPHIHIAVILITPYFCVEG